MKLASEPLKIAAILLGVSAASAWAQDGAIGAGENAPEASSALAVPERPADPNVVIVRIVRVKGYEGLQKFKEGVRELLGPQSTIVEKEMSRGTVTFAVRGGGPVDQLYGRIKDMQLDDGIRPKIRKDGDALEVDVL